MKPLLIAVLVGACSSNAATHLDAAAPDGPAVDALPIDGPDLDAAIPVDGPTPVEICDNGIDDDGNTKVDCADPVCSSTAHCTIAAHTIQEIQDGTVVTGTRAALTKVFVTAVRVSGGGSVIATIQEPDGVTSGGHVYPEYAGVALFISHAETLQFPGSGTIAIGDCISISGTVIEFQTTTEVLTPTAFTAEPTGTCGAMPSPLVIASGAVSFAEIASDSDPATMGDQVGTKAEVYEGVLVRVGPVSALAPPENNVFQVSEDAGTGATILVGNFAYTSGTVTATAGQMFTSITGILGQRTRYQLWPRAAGDLQ